MPRSSKGDFADEYVRTFAEKCIELRNYARRLDNRFDNQGFTNTTTPVVDEHAEAGYGEELNERQCVRLRALAVDFRALVDAKRPALRAAAISGPQVDE